MKIFGHFMSRHAIALALSEMLLMATAAYFFLGPSGAIGSAQQLFFGTAQGSLVFAVFAFLVMLATGLYNYDAFLNYRGTAIRTVLAFVLFLPLILAVTLLLRVDSSGELGNIPSWCAKAAIVWCASIIVSRMVFVHVAGLSALKRRVVVVGTGSLASKIGEIGAQSLSQFIPVAFVGLPHERDPIIAPHSMVSHEGTVGDLMTIAANERATEVVVAAEDRRGLPVHQLLKCKVTGLKVTDYFSFIERETGRVDLEGLQPSWLIFSDGFRSGKISRVLKRGFDILSALAVLVLTFPVLIVTAILIPLESDGPILYRQERVGQYGKTFVLFKFRSMQQNAERPGAPQWALEQDPRVTKIGAWIRKIRIDELPQLVNVLKGEMSFVGPRPERPKFVSELSDKLKFYNERHALKPGITGWAQINYPYGASVEDAKRKLEYDLYYVKNYSPFLDLAILVTTLRVILFPEGAR